MVGGCKEASVFLDLLSVATPNWFVSVICIFQADKECSLSYIIGADTVEELDVLEYGVSINGLSALGLIYHHNNILIIRDHQLSDDP